jgi:hypothetical protein
VKGRPGMRGSTSLLVVAALAQLGCANSYLYAPTEASARQMAPDAARETLRNALTSCGGLADVAFYPDHFTTVFQNGSGEVRYYYKDLDDVRMRYLARIGPDHVDVGSRVRLVNTAQGKEFKEVLLSCDVLGTMPSGYDAQRIADALLRLKLEYEARFGAEATNAFQGSTAPPGAGQVPAALPGEVDALHAQAKVAIGNKNLVTAAERYDRVVALAPAWPEGHFNAALILGELDAVDAAGVEMRRYLYLNPAGSADPLASSKIAEWGTPAFPVDADTKASVPQDLEFPLHGDFAYVYDATYGHGGTFGGWFPLPLGTSWSRLFIQAHLRMNYARDTNLETMRVSLPLALAYELGTSFLVSVAPRVGLDPYLTSSDNPAVAGSGTNTWGVPFFAGGSVTFGGAFRLLLSGDIYATNPPSSVWSGGFRF